MTNKPLLFATFVLIAGISSVSCAPTDIGNPPIDKRDIVTIFDRRECPPTEPCENRDSVEFHAAAGVFPANATVRIYDMHRPQHARPIPVTEDGSFDFTETFSQLEALRLVIEDNGNLQTIDYRVDGDSLKEDLHPLDRCLTILPKSTFAIAGANTIRFENRCERQINLTATLVTDVGDIDPTDGKKMSLEHLEGLETDIQQATPTEMLIQLRERDAPTWLGMLVLLGNE